MRANNVVLSGNLARDPEVRETKDGTLVANFTVAVNQRRWNKEDNDWESRLDGFFDCVAWRKQAEIVRDNAAKGDLVYVIGNLRQNKWETAEGDTRSKVEVNATEIGFHMPTDGNDRGRDSSNDPF